MTTTPEGTGPRGLSKEWAAALSGAARTAERLGQRLEERQARRAVAIRALSTSLYCEPALAEATGLPDAAAWLQELVPATCSRVQNLDRTFWLLSEDGPTPSSLGLILPGAARPALGAVASAEAPARDLADQALAAGCPLVWLPSWSVLGEGELVLTFTGAPGALPEVAVTVDGERIPGHWLAAGLSLQLAHPAFQALTPLAILQTWRDGVLGLTIRVLPGQG
jgi:hypothetical protein